MISRGNMLYPPITTIFESKDESQEPSSKKKSKSDVESDHSKGYTNNNPRNLDSPLKISEESKTQLPINISRRNPSNKTTSV